GRGRAPEALRREPPRGARAAGRRRGHAGDRAFGHILRRGGGIAVVGIRADLRHPIRRRERRHPGTKVARGEGRPPGRNPARGHSRRMVRYPAEGQEGRGFPRLSFHRSRLSARSEAAAGRSERAPACRDGARRNEATLRMRTSLEPPVPLLDLGAVHGPLEDELTRDFERVLRSGQFILGPEHDAFETELAVACGVEHAIGIASGTAALSIALLALGLEPGDEVIVPAFTYFASASAVTSIGARPVFVDVEPERMGLNPAEVEAAITPRTRAIMAVH